MRVDRQHGEGEHGAEHGDDPDREDGGVEAGPVLDDVENRVLLRNRKVSRGAHREASGDPCDRIVGAEEDEHLRPAADLSLPGSDSPERCTKPLDWSRPRSRQR
jgi:hypothetical protein